MKPCYLVGGSTILFKKEYAVNMNSFCPEELLQVKNPSEVGTVHTSVRRIELGDRIQEIQSGDEELCIVCIEGNLTFEIDGISGEAKMKDMLYVPIGSVLAVRGTDAVLMRFGASCDRKTKFVHIKFDEVDTSDRHKVYGKIENGTRRDVWNFIDESFDSPRFLCGMCKGSNGGWTAWPPHEHAAKREEVYVYFNMGNSFGAQFVYDDMDNPYTVALIKNGSVVTIPKGFHPNVGSPSGGIFYAYIMVSLQPEDRNFMDLHVDATYGDRLE